MATKQANKQKNKSTTKCSYGSTIPSIKGMSRAEVTEWVNLLKKASDNSCNKAQAEFDEEVCDSDSFKIDDHHQAEESEMRQSNVIFCPGNTTEDTLILVDDIEISGVDHAVLEYDTRLGVPLLNIRIIAPQISSL